MKSSKIAFCLGALFSSVALAGPADYVYTPNVEYGEREIDFKYGWDKLPSGQKEQAASLGFGYGASEKWFTEVYVKYEQAAGQGTHIDAFEWENKFQLTETGQYAVDVGLITEIEIPARSGGAYEFRFGPLFQREFGKLQLNANLLFERKYGGDLDPGEGPRKTGIGYQWQAKYRWQPALEFGMQGFGEMGEWNHWDQKDQQNHRLGPALFGKVALGNHQVIKYNAAWLAGVSQAAPDHTFRLQAEYEF